MKKLLLTIGCLALASCSVRIGRTQIDQQKCLDRCTTAILQECDDHMDGSMCQRDANFYCDDICQVSYDK